MKYVYTGTLAMCASILLSGSAIAGETTGETYIDIHFHADARPEGGGELPKVAEWMKANRVDRLIIMQYRKTLPRDEQEAQRMVKNFKAYQGKIYRFCVLLPNDIPNKDAAVKALKKMKDEGAIGFGEHYGRRLSFDDPKCMQLYAACAEVGLPVLFHMDGGNNKDDADLSHLENALKSYPKCVFIGHGPGFWAKMKVVDGLLGKHKNLYADISAGSGANAVGRDKEYSRAFLARHADRALFGTDGGPWSFGKKSPPQFELIESLKLPPDVKAKLCRENAELLFKLDRQ
jgi:predicted TIM-barrel fold metal-dependent hydrolase